MNKVLIATTNPVKIEAVKNAFSKMFFTEDFEYVGISVSSEVSDQPMSDRETLLGAMNRVKNLMAEDQKADYWVGLEGGIEETYDEESGMRGFAWMYIVSKEKIIGKSRTATFSIPFPVAQLIREGKELGVADDIVFGRENSKQGNGAVGILTKDLINRAKYYEHALILALIPFKNKEIYTKTIIQKPKVYFAASIRGGRDEQKNYEKIILELKKHANVLTEHFADKNLTSMGMENKSNEEIYEQDLKWINEAEIIVAEVTQPSLGVGYELGKAEDLGKKVLCLYRETDGRSLSAMIAGTKNFEVKRYKNVEEVEKILEDYFEASQKIL